eukprot:scaffold38788_cov221-Amphora_coffeaeformis.AAC.4
MIKRGSHHACSLVHTSDRLTKKGAKNRAHKSPRPSRQACWLSIVEGAVVAWHWICVALKTVVSLRSSSLEKDNRFCFLCRLKSLLRMSHPPIDLFRSPVMISSSGYKTPKYLMSNAVASTQCSQFRYIPSSYRGDNHEPIGALCSSRVVKIANSLFKCHENATIECSSNA